MDNIATESKRKNRHPAVRILAVAAIAAPLLWAWDPLRLFQTLLLTEQFIAIEFGLSLSTVFLSGQFPTRSAWRNSGEIFLAASSLAICGWIAWRFNSFDFIFFLYGPEPIFLSFSLIGLTILGCYRAAGGPMTAIVIAFLAYGYGAQFLPGDFSAPSVAPGGYVTYIALGGDAIMGLALTIMATVVVVFVIFGKAFEFAGGAAFIEQLALSAFSRSRGGPLKVSVLASGLLGSISGSTVSNVMTSGSFSIPMMRRIGVSPHNAAAVEAVSSTGGQLLPPVMGAAAFLMSDIARIAYTDVIVAAAIPGLLFYFAVFVQADGLAARLKLKQEDVGHTLDRNGLIKEGAFYAIPVCVIVVTLLRYDHVPARAALIGAAVAILLALIRCSDIRNFLERLAAASLDTGILSARLIVAGAAIGIMLGVINSTSLGVLVAIAVSGITGGGLLVPLIVAAVASYLLGIGLATSAVYVIVGTLIAPGLVEIGVEPMAAHLFVFYTAMLSMITPPVAIACFAASNLAGASFLRTSVAAMRIGWPIFVLPFLFVLYPALLLIGEPLEIAITVASVAVAILLASQAASGYCASRLSTGARLARLSIAAFLLMPPLPLAVKGALSIATLVFLLGWRASR